MSNTIKTQNTANRLMGDLKTTGTLLPRLAIDLLSPEDAASYIHKSTSSLAKLRVYGGGPEYFKVGRRVFYDVADLDVWLQARRRHSTSDHGQ